MSKLENGSVFDFNFYKDYLRSLAGPRTERRGVRAMMAKTLGCQSTYVSQVLYGQAHFSLEQAEVLSDFFRQAPQEKVFFLLLVQKDRAGTRRLEQFFLKEIEKARRARSEVGVGKKDPEAVDEEFQGLFYSSWEFAAVLAGLNIKKLRTPSALATFYSLPKKRVSEILSFLSAAGLVKKEGTSFQPIKEIVYLKRGSSLHLRKAHHANWRLRALESFDYQTDKDIHFSSVWSFSKAETERMFKLVEDFAREMASEFAECDETPSEVFVFNVDFFDLSRNKKKPNS